MIRHHDGTVTHNGEYNPWLELDKAKEKECRESGGFVMRVGTVNVRTGRHENDGLLYVKIGD